MLQLFVLAEVHAASTKKQMYEGSQKGYRQDELSGPTRA